MINTSKPRYIDRPFYTIHLPSECVATFLYILKKEGQKREKNERPISVGLVILRLAVLIQELFI